MQNTSPDITNKSVDTSIYTPSSSDKKRAVIMYLFLGIMVWITKKNINSFEYYHLKQASGRWILFLLILVFDVVLLFVPIIKYLWLIPILVLLVLWIINVKQARDGKYFVNSKASPLALLSWVGGWFLDLFEVNLDHNTTNKNEIISDIELDTQNKNTSNQ